MQQITGEQLSDEVIKSSSKSNPQVSFRKCQQIEIEGVEPTDCQVSMGTKVLPCFRWADDAFGDVTRRRRLRHLVS